MLVFVLRSYSKYRIPVALSSSVSLGLKGRYVRIVLFQHLTSVFPCELTDLTQPLYKDLGGTMYLVKLPSLVAAMVPLR